MKPPLFRPAVVRLLLSSICGVLLLLASCGGAPAVGPSGNGQSGGGDPIEAPQFLFVGGQEFVRTIKLASDGTMSQVGETPVPGMVSPRAMTATPDGKYLYVGTDVYGTHASQGQIALLAFKIDSATGTLSPVDGSPFEYSENPQNLSVTPDGKFLIAAGNGIYRQFAIDANTGGISEADNLNINENACCTFRRVFDPARPFFYDITGIGDTIHVFDLDPTFGIEDAGFETNPVSDAYVADIAIDPAGKYLYAAENGAGAIQAFLINDDNSLSPLGAPFSLGGSSGLVGPMAMDASGKHLFVAFDGDVKTGTTSKVAVVNVDGASGTLSMPTAAVEQNIPYARAAVVDSTGMFLLFNAATDSGVVGFKVDVASAALTSLPSNSAVASAQGNAVVVVQENGR